MTQDNMNFTTGSIFRKLIGFMMPILGALLLQTMYGAVDILVVGWFGTDVGISAVSTGSSFINMIVFILNGLAMGVTVLMGRYIGEKNEGRLGKVIGGAIVTFLAIAAVMTVLLLVFAPGLSTVMQAPKDAIDKTIVYIRICGGGIVFIIGYNLISSIFRGIGNSRLPLLFVGIACAVNVVLDLVFVAVFRWDVAGAAFATVIAQAVSLILSVLVCTKINLPFHIRKSDLRFSGEVQKFLTNAVYCLQQNVANKSMGDYAKGKVWGNNLVFCALAGVLWYMQFFGLEMGKSFLTESPVLLAFSWCILMALNVTFSNVWGIILKEWKGVSNKTITVLIAGLIVLVFSLVFPNLF